MSASLEYERARPYEPFKTIAPRRLAAAPAEDLGANATVAEPFTLHNCGLVGSPGFSRTIPAGTRARLEPAGAGLVRCHLSPGGGRGSLVGAEHFEIDEDVRHGF